MEGEEGDGLQDCSSCGELATGSGSAWMAPTVAPRGMISKRFWQGNPSRILCTSCKTANHLSTERQSRLNLRNNEHVCKNHNLKRAMQR